jgi:hypothetical protein
MAREADPDADPNAHEAPDAPPAAGDDNESNPLDQEGDYAPNDLDNLDAIIRRDMIAMYVCVFGFKEGTAIALYEDQQITDLDPLRELNNPTIKELCRQIGKESHPVLMIS